MCGIIGYVGKRDAYPILIKGLHRLEYRGYDSAGVALINEAGKLNVFKAKGKVAELETFATDKDTTGHIGIAHTRWATHGEPNTANAHPHYSASERLAIIHNGIIENYSVLKAGLMQEGYSFKSDTDTENLPCSRSSAPTPSWSLTKSTPTHSSQPAKGRLSWWVLATTNTSSPLMLLPSWSTPTRLSISKTRRSSP